MDINIEEVKKYIEENKDDEHVKAFRDEMSRIPAEKEKEIVANYLKSTDYVSKLNSEKDSHFSKSLKTWQENNLPKIIEEEIHKRFPEETKEQKELREVKSALEQIKNESKRKEITNKMFKELSARSLPVELADYLNIPDEADVESRLDSIKNLIEPLVQAEVDRRLKKAPGAPDSNKDKVGGKPIYTTRESLVGVKPDEIAAATREGRIRITGVDLNALKKKQ
jgi:flagellar biosynthesis GTPase FlhF